MVANLGADQINGRQGFLRKNVEAYVSCSGVGGRLSQCWERAEEGIVMYSLSFLAGPLALGSENVLSYCFGY